MHQREHGTVTACRVKGHPQAPGGGEGAPLCPILDASSTGRVLLWELRGGPETQGGQWLSWVVLVGRGVFNIGYGLQEGGGRWRWEGGGERGQEREKRRDRENTEEVLCPRTGLPGRLDAPRGPGHLIWL